MNYADLMSSMNEELEKNPDVIDGGGKKKFEADERFYKISKDSDGSGTVIIRFLPTFNKDKTHLIPSITVPKHVVNNKRGEDTRFISVTCSKTFGNEDCPICSYCWDNFNEGKEAGLANDSKEQKSFLKFAPNDHFITNIMVIKDELNPQNEGKVFLFEYKAQLAKLIKTETNPTDKEVQYKGKTKFNAWDVFNGRNFVLTLTSGKFTDNGYPSWTESFFAAENTPLVESEDEFKELLEKTHDINEFVSSDSKYNLPEDELQQKLDYILFRNTKGKSQKKPVQEESEEESKGSVEDMYKKKPEPTPEPIKEDTPPFEPDEKEEKPAPKKESKPQDKDDFFAKFNA